MMLVEEAQVPLEALPVAEFRAHLRLGSGFTDDSLQDAVLDGFLRASLAAIEARTGKAILARSVLWRAYGWDAPEAQRLGIAPVASIETVRLMDATGVLLTDIDEDVRLAADAHVPVLRPMGTVLPRIPRLGFVEIAATVGYGATWADVPSDLQQAVLLLAAHFYEFRHETALSGGCMPFGVTSLIERYRLIRIGMERAR